MKYESIKLKYLADMFNGNSIPDDLKSEYEGKEIPYIPTKELNVEDSTINYNNGLSVNRGDGFKIAPTNSVLMCIEGGSAGRKIALTDREVAFVNKLCCISGVKVDSRYLFHALRSKDFTEQFFLNMTGLIGGVSINVLKNLYVSLPSNKETQRKLISILDQKCGKIDELIANQQAQIEKLKEYKQSVITEAVTKGLDKSAPMKDSGVEWIGNIPDGWTIQKVLYQLKMPVTDGPHTTPELFDNGVAFVSAEAVSCGNGGIDFNHIRGYVSEEFYQECCLKYIPEIDDVYVIKSGATTGRVSIVTTLEPKFTIWSPLAVMRTNKDKMLPKFLYYAIQSTHFQRQIALGWSYGTQQNLGMRTLEQLQLLVPSLEEQRCIIEYLDGNLIKIDRILAIKQEKIEKLQEYKKSLIYEYVTGKKKVV